MWIYKQSTGELFLNSLLMGVGYSGSPEGKNNPEKQNFKNIGPIPVGYYKIGEAFTHKSKGPVCMRLEPYPSNRMFGRSGFMIHGDSISEPGKASQGCIILNKIVRKLISEFNDKVLQVI